MWNFIVLFTVLAAMDTEAVSVRRRYASPVGSYSGTGGYVSSGTGSGGYAGGFAGGYAGGFADTGYYAPDFGLSAAFLDPYVFHQQLTAQIHAQHAAQQNAFTMTQTTGGASATAGASVLPDNDAIHRQVASQQAYFDAIRRRNHIRGGGYSSHRYAPSYASAGGSVGTGGHYQTAVISPSNPDSPNIVNRFSTGSGPGGYKGVSVSSYSSSADVNGRRTGVRGAQTTVNDNGKITSYTVHS